MSLGGLVLVEAFTPSNVAALYRALSSLADTGVRGPADWHEALTRSRSGARGGWLSLGSAQRSGPFADSIDPTLPASIASVAMSLHFVAPSLTLVIATFTIDETSGDLSPLLRTEYRTEIYDVRIDVMGRFAGLRSRFPWSRPARYGSSYRMRRPDEMKQLACDDVMTEIEATAWEWMRRRFPGRFAREPLDNRPAVRVLLTTTGVPFVNRSSAFSVVDLDFATPAWRCDDIPGWWWSQPERRRSRRFVALLSARRTDAARNPVGATEEDSISTWTLVHRLGRYYPPLISRWAAVCLLNLYADKLAALRDRAAVHRRPRRPVQQARELDDFLIGDGLDATSVAADIAELATDVRRFEWHVPDHTEYIGHLPADRRADVTPASLVPELRELLSRLVRRLRTDTEATTGSIRASAELRQAVANTRLQRITVSVTLVATVLALVSLLVALGRTSK